MKVAVLEKSPPKEEEGGEGGGGERINEDRAKETVNGFHSHLELRLGFSLNNGLEGSEGKGGGCGGGGGGGGGSPTFRAPQDGHVTHQRSGVGIGGTKRCFSETTTGFVHPWSLAARQEKAALEQAHKKTNPSSTVLRGTNPSPSIVGWPPIRAFRRNLGLPQASKSAMDSEKDMEKMKPVEEENPSNDPVARQTMFVKVNMEGYAVGRKIDLKANRAGFIFYPADYSKKSKEDGEEDVVTPSYILLYEDNEGDRMLDVHQYSEKAIYCTRSKNTKMWLTTFELSGESNYRGIDSSDQRDQGEVAYGIN
ncbi:auxin-responsive protein IAA25 [Cocos nucifera]|uniref:Auxin-responsive protein n=1 Tax=Cocos nucifera TaxID=13894 RepID=A0A8K0MW02_COCNU|nr:auxin-responsive protein IAA25 [Cocos nucifera]